jgi:hypothetical protein
VLRLKLDKVEPGPLGHLVLHLGLAVVDDLLAGQRGVVGNLGERAANVHGKDLGVLDVSKKQGPLARCSTGVEQCAAVDALAGLLQNALPSVCRAYAGYIQCLAGMTNTRNCVLWRTCQCFYSNARFNSWYNASGHSP